MVRKDSHTGCPFESIKLEQGHNTTFFLYILFDMSMEHQPTREKLYSTSKGYGFSPALQRTRKPFAVRNMLTLAGLLTFAGSVCKSLSQLVYNSY